MTGLPRVSVVVPVHDDPRLDTCLAALECQDYPPDLVELLVVDNASTTPVHIDPQRHPRVNLLHEGRPGSYAARNAAVRTATGDVLAFTDADCIPRSSWLSAGVDALRSADLVAGHIEVFARDELRMHPVEAYEVVRGFPQQVYLARGGACATANLFSTARVFADVGLFRDDLRSGGDVEWTRRAARAGHVAVYCPDAVVRHPARQTFGEMYRKLQRVQQGRTARDGGRAAVTRQLVPALGAVGRAARSDRLPTTRGRAAYVAGEFFCRYAGAWAAWRSRA